MANPGLSSYPQIQTIPSGRQERHHGRAVSHGGRDGVHCGDAAEEETVVQEPDAVLRCLHAARPAEAAGALFVPETGVCDLLHGLQDAP